MKEVDSQVLEHRQVISSRSLESRRNDLTLIYQLPDEILCEIFIFASSESPQTVGKHISHVCGSWRSAALRCPSMWSYLDFDDRGGTGSPEWMQEMLRRAMHAPLTVRVHDSCWPNVPMTCVVQEALVLLDHIIDLELFDPPFAVRETVLAQPAPLLRRLVIRSFGEAFIIGEDIFAGVSALSCIEVSGCHLDWSASWLRHLTHLSIASPGPGLASPSQVLAALGQMLSLQSLDLFFACKEERTGTPTVTLDRARLISLPHLSKLALTLEFDDLHFLLLHLRIPSTSRVLLKLAGITDISHQRVTDVLTAIHGDESIVRFAQASHKLHLQATGHLLVLAFWSVHESTAEEYIKLRLWFDWPTAPASARAVIQIALISFLGWHVPLLNIRTLTMADRENVDEDVQRWQGQLLRACCMVRELNLREKDPHILRALGSADIFPKLEILCVDVGESSAISRILLEALRTRADASMARLQTLKFRRVLGQLDGDDVAALRLLVDTVEIA